MVQFLGSKFNTATNPLDGIALNEKFSYEIVAKGDELKVSIINWLGYLNENRDA